MTSAERTPAPAPRPGDVRADDGALLLAPPVAPLRAATGADLAEIAEDGGAGAAETPATTAERGLPVAWWGVVWMIATEATLFGGLLSSWFFVRAGSDRWPPAGIEVPPLGRISVFTVVLLGSSLPMIWAERAGRRGHIGQLRWALALTWILGATFLTNQALEYRELTFGWQDNTYASLFYVITGLHGLHVVVGLVALGVVQLKAAMGLIGPRRHLTLRVVALYWHFVDVVWIAVFSSLYLATHVR